MYRCEATLKSALDSIFRSAQLFRTLSPLHLEVVAVDDASPDRSFQVADAYREQGVRVLRLPENGGAGKARNEGVRNCQGDFVLFLDSDDRYLPEHILLALAPFYLPGGEAFGFVRTGLAFCDERSAALSVDPNWKIACESMSPITLAVRKSCFTFLGGFDEDEFTRQHGNEDGLFAHALRTYFKGARVPQDTAVYVRRKGNALDRQMDKFQGRAFVDETHFSKPIQALIQKRAAQVESRRSKWCGSCPIYPPGQASYVEIELNASAA